MKTLGPKFGARLKEVLTAIAGVPAATLAAQVQAGQPFELLCAGGPVTLEPADLVVQRKAPEGWAGAVDRQTQVLVDARVTEELAREGMARDVVRQVQELRKKAQLEMEDRIVLGLFTESVALKQAIETHRAYLAGETLTSEWAAQPVKGQVHRADVKVDGQALTIELRKAAG